MTDKEKNEQNKNEKKRRKTVAGFFSSLNTTTKNSEKEMGTVEVNPKSKIAKWIFVGAIAAITIPGIAIPWGLSSCVAKHKLPINPSEIMYSYINPITGQVINVTFEQWKEQINSNHTSSKFISKWENVFNESVLEDLYNEEREAFLRFKAIIENTKYKNEGKKVANDEFGYDVSKSIEDVKKEQQNILNANKKNFQKSLGNGWLDKWLLELQTNSIYGPQTLEGATTNDISKLEKQAVEFMKLQVIKEPALARYRSAEVNTDQWSVDDLTRNNTEEIKYTNVNGEEQTISANSVKDSFYAKFLTDKNHVKKLKGTVEERKKIAVFQTKSYIPEWRVPNGTLKDVFTKYYNSATISSINLDIKPNDINNQPFTLTNTLLENLFKIVQIDDKVYGQQISNFVPFNQLSNFKGALTNSDASSKAKDSQLILSLAGAADSTPTDDSKKLGTTENKILSDLLGSSNESRQFNLAAIGSDGTKFSKTNSENYQLYTPKKQNPFEIFMDELMSIDLNDANPSPKFTNRSWMKAKWDAMLKPSFSQSLKPFIELLKQSFDWNSSSNKQLSLKASINFSDFNDSLKTITSALSEDDLKYLGALVSVSLMDEKAKIDENNPGKNYQDGYWTLYELSSNTTYLFVSKDGMKIFTRDIITQENKEPIDQMILSDLDIKINESEGKVSLYNVATLYEKINDSNIIINELLTNTIYNDGSGNNKFKDSFMNKIDEKLNDNSKNSQEIYNKFLANVEAKILSTITESNKSVTEGLKDFLKTIVESKKYYEYKLVKDIATNEEYYEWQKVNNSNNNVEVIPNTKGFDSIYATYFERLYKIANKSFK